MRVAAHSCEGVPSRLRQLVKGAMAAALPRSLFMTHGPRQSNRVFLTFDDGPHPRYTPAVLDVLGRLAVPATFFLIGENVVRDPGLARRIVVEGHSIGHHTFGHRSPTATSAKQLIREVEECDRLFEGLMGRRSPIFRPPWGKLTLGKVLRLWAAGKTIVLWSLDPKDCIATSAHDLQVWFEAHPLSAGDILLLHDDQAYTPEVLPNVIDTARAKGLTFAALDT